MFSEELKLYMYCNYNGDLCACWLITGQRFIIIIIIIIIVL